MFALNVFGPALKYRLDLLKYSSYDIREKIVILTDRISYEKFYTDFHEDYTFIFVEDYMSKYDLSTKNEILPNVFENEEDHFTNFSAYYSSINNFFSFDIHRFLIEYFISKGIKKFLIIDSDTILKNDLTLVEEFFDSIPEKSILAPSLGIEQSLELKTKFWNEMTFDWLPNGIHLSGDVPFFDGWFRGFNFDTLDDAQKFFDIWNTCYLKLLDERFNPTFHIYKNGEGPLIWSNEWVFSNCTEIFRKYLSYNVDLTIAIQPGIVYMPGTSIYVARHAPRPEDNLYHKLEKYIDENGVERYPSRGAWYDYRFNYDQKRTVSSFIMNNKDELIRYYKSIFPEVNATDTHIYTKLT